MLNESGNEVVENNGEAQKTVEDFSVLDGQGASEDGTSKEVVKEETGPSFFSKIFKTMFNQDEEPAGEESNDGTPAEEVLEVEPELYDAAKEHGWDDERIAKYYKEDKAVLEALAKNHKPAAAPIVKEEEKSKPALEPVALDAKALNDMKEQYGDDVVNNVISPLLTKLNQTIETVNRQEENHKKSAADASRQESTQRYQTFQNEMDRLGSQYEIFGTWEKVPQTKEGQIDTNSPMFKSRDEVWRTAQLLNRTGSDWKTAVEDSVAMYKGRNLENLVQANLIKKLNAQKLKFTPRPTAKKVEVAALSGDAHKKSVIKQALKDIGKE